MAKQRTYLGAYSGDDPDFKKAGDNLGWLPTRKPNVYSGTDRLRKLLTYRVNSTVTIVAVALRFIRAVSPAL
jgi:hypothetical protein